MCETLNILTELLSGKYLGLPALVGADRSDCFQYQIDRVRAKTKGWKEKLLSMGGGWQRDPDKVNRSSHTSLCDYGF